MRERLTLKCLHPLSLWRESPLCPVTRVTAYERERRLSRAREASSSRDKYSLCVTGLTNVAFAASPHTAELPSATRVEPDRRDYSRTWR